MSNAKDKYADMDPVEEIRAVRKELGRRFPTPKALCEYLWKHYPTSRPIPELPPEPEEPKSRRALAKPKTRANTRPAVRQRKTTAHA